MESTAAQQGFDFPPERPHTDIGEVHGRRNALSNNEISGRGTAPSKQQAAFADESRGPESARECRQPGTNAGRYAADILQ